MFKLKYMKTDYVFNFKILLFYRCHTSLWRNHFVLTGFGTYAEVDVFDSSLDDEAGSRWGRVLAR